MKGLTGNSTVIDFTKHVGESLAAEFDCDPQGELLAWIKIAVRREAMVADAYSWQHIKRRIQCLREAGIHESILKRIQEGIRGAWAQEESHAALLRATLSNASDDMDVSVSTGLELLMGRLEGKILSWKLSPSQLQNLQARAAIALGGLFKSIPTFMNELRTLPMGGYLAFNAQLEETAIDGYTRMVSLIDRIKAQVGRPPFQSTIRYDMASSLVEEQYHANLFSSMAKWFDGDTLRLGVTLRSCEDVVASIATKHFARPLHALADIPPGAVKKQATLVLAHYWRRRLQQPSLRPKGYKELRSFESPVCFVGKPPFFDLIADRFPQVVLVPRESVTRELALGEVIEGGQQAALHFPGIAPRYAGERKSRGRPKEPLTEAHINLEIAGELKGKLGKEVENSRFPERNHIGSEKSGLIEKGGWSSGEGGAGEGGSWGPGF